MEAYRRRCRRYAKNQVLKELGEYFGSLFFIILIACLLYI